MSEAASAPIPPQLSRSGDPLGEAAFRDTSIRVVPERNGAHIPSFYIQHEDPSGTVVTQDGVPIPGVGDKKLGFTVADVAPERRWAITESGEVLPQHVFESKLLLTREEWFERVAKLKPPGDLKKETVKAVKDFVSVTPDPVNPARLIPIGFDPNAKPDPEAVKRLYDSKRDEFYEGDERLEMLLDAYENPKMQGKLKPWEVDEVEDYLRRRGRHVGGTNDLATKLEQLNELLASGDITPEVHSRRVAGLTGADRPQVVPQDSARQEPDKPETRRGYMTKPCGAEVRKFDSKKHDAECGKCGKGVPEA